MPAAKTSAIGQTRHADPIDKIVAELIAEAELPASVKLRRVDPQLADQADQVFDRLTAAQDEEAAKPTVRRHRKVDLDGAALALAEERTRLLITGGNLIDACLDIAELGVVVARQVAGAEAAARMANMRPAQPQLPPPPPPDSFDGGDNTEDFHGLRADHDRWDAGEADRRWLIAHLQGQLDDGGHGWVHANDERMEDLVRAHEKEHHGDRSTHKQAHSSGEWHGRVVGQVIDPDAPTVTLAVRVGGWWRRARGWLRPAAIAAAAILAAITLGGGS